MGKKDPRVDAYIAKSAEFARPVMQRIRELVHAACPAVEETIKWGMPHFMHHGMLCGMAAFKQHCTFGFWHAAMRDSVDDVAQEKAMGQFGRMTGISDLPKPALFKKLVKQAAKLNEDGIKTLKQARTKQRAPLRVPADLRAALAKDKLASANFKAMSYSHQKEYIEWISEAKREETRQRRVNTTIEWLAAGKSRNWKYEKRAAQ